MKKRPGRQRRFPDPFDFERHKGWQRSRGQALFRDEEWTLTVEEFFEIWPKGRWESRGTGVGNYVMTRRDPTQPWNKENTIVVPRLQQMREKVQRMMKTRNKEQV